MGGRGRVPARPRRKGPIGYFGRAAPGTPLAKALGAMGGAEAGRGRPRDRTHELLDERPVSDDLASGTAVASRAVC